MSLYLLDKDKTLLAVVDPLEHEQTMTLGGLITATVSVEYNAEMENAHYFGATDVDDDNVFAVYYITYAEKYEGRYNLRGVHLLYHELQGEVVRDIRPTNALASVALGSILGDGLWEVGDVYTAKIATSNYYYTSRLSAYQQFLKDWDVECVPRITWSNGAITGRYIDIYDRLSGNYGKWYEYGDKLLIVTAESTSDEIYTALVGMGKGEQVGDDAYGRKIKFSDIVWAVADGDPLDKPDGQDYLVMPEAAAEYGLRIGIVDFHGVTEPLELLQKTYQELQAVSRPKVSFKASAVEVGMMELGETVTIIRDDLGIRYQTRVYEVTRNFLDRKVKTFKLGDSAVKTVASRLAGRDREAQARDNAIESYLIVVRNEIIKAYFDEDGYNYDIRVGNEFGLPAGYYSFDRPIDQDPSKVVYMGAGKILVANAKLPDDSWDWRTAVDGDGIVADVITSGMLKGGNVKWNLEDGTLLIGESVADHQLYYDGETLSIKGKIILSSGGSLEDELDEKFTDIAGDHSELGKRIKAYEDQIVLDSDLGLIAIQIKTDNGWKYAMTLSQGKLSFYSNGVEISYFSDNQMTIEAAVIEQTLQVGNHTMQKQGNEFTIFKYTGGGE